MNVQKTDEFIGDIERQYEWYAAKAGVEIADHYLNAVESVCRLLSQQPALGPLGGFQNPKLSSWRFFPVLRPFQKHVLFYEVRGKDLILRRAMHGHRDLPKRLLEPPQ